MGPDGTGAHRHYWAYSDLAESAALAVSSTYHRAMKFERSVAATAPWVPLEEREYLRTGQTDPRAHVYAPWFTAAVLSAFLWSAIVWILVSAIDDQLPVSALSAIVLALAAVAATLFSVRQHRRVVQPAKDLREALARWRSEGAVHDADLVGASDRSLFGNALQYRDEAVRNAHVSTVIDPEDLGRRIDDLLWQLSVTYVDIAQVADRIKDRGAATPTQSAALQELGSRSRAQYSQIKGVAEQVEQICKLRPDPEGDGFALDALARAEGASVAIGGGDTGASLQEELTVLENLLRHDL
jgi:hypothetical protein